LTGHTAITQLTIRQFLRAKSVLVVAALCAIPILFALILRANLDADLRREVIGEAIFLGLFGSTLLPLAALVLSTAALGDELEDKTLPYLTLKPVSRIRIVLEKYVGTLVILVPLAWAALLAVWIVTSWGDLDATRDLMWPMLAASFAGIAAFAALFMLISLYIQRALLIGVFYVFVWEATLSQFLPGIRTISIRHYMQSMFVRMVDDDVIGLPGVSRLPTSIITLSIVTLIALVLAAFRLRRMNLE
jgi:ABC-2 type transport system permease protein